MGLSLKMQTGSHKSCFPFKNGRKVFQVGHFCRENNFAGKFQLYSFPFKLDLYRYCLYLDAFIVIKSYTQVRQAFSVSACVKLFSCNLRLKPPDFDQSRFTQQLRLTEIFYLSDLTTSLTEQID